VGNGAASFTAVTAAASSVGRPDVCTTFTNRTLPSLAMPNSTSRKVALYSQLGVAAQGNASFSSMRRRTSPR